MEHLLQRNKRSISHNIFKYVVFQRRYYGVKGNTISNAHADTSIKTSCIIFDMSLHLYPYFVYVSKECSGKAVIMPILA